jgi:hypothetical protein
MLHFRGTTLGLLRARPRPRFGLWQGPRSLVVFSGAAAAAVVDVVA